MVQLEGPGAIPNDELKHIFEQFFRGKASQAKKIGGTGIGLNIVHNIISVHNGKVTVMTNKGQGSTFTVSLPVITSQRGKVL